MNSLPANPFAPVPLLFMAPHVDSEFLAFLQDGHKLGVDFPQILVAINEDLDLHGQQKKALRIADAQWSVRRSPIASMARAA